MGNYLAKAFIIKRRGAHAARAKDDEGALLILVVIFMVVIAFMLKALLTFSGNDITNTANLQHERDLEYSSDGAIDAAIQAVRFSCYAFDGTTHTCSSNRNDDCLPNGAAFVDPNENTQTMTFYSTEPEKLAIVVDCSGTVKGHTQNTRIITFSACRAGITCTSSNAAVSAQVTFQDYGRGGAYTTATGRPSTCSSPPKVATCGIGIVVERWTVRKG